MVPASSDVLAWIAEELGMIAFREGDDGRAMPVAGGGSSDLTLAEAVAAAAGLPPDDADVLALIEAARRGDRGSLPIPGPGDAGRVVAWRGEDRAVQVLVAPSSEVMARRAAAADLAAGVTHEVANALTAIAGWTRMAASGGPLPDRTKQALEVVQRSARDALGSARGLLRTMRDTGDRRSIPANPIQQTDVAEVVREVLQTLRPELSDAGIALDADLEEGILGAAPAPALRLIVSNLVRNAYEALDGGGRIEVSVRDQGDRYLLAVCDDGPGMTRRTLGLAFDRYFTTKQQGTGLGLALVRDTVHDAGGRVEVQSRRGSGTRFEVSLPTAGAARLGHHPAIVSTSSSGVHPRPFLVHRRVLVVDDDDAMRSMVRTALGIQGAAVITAASTAEALELTEPVDIALVDLALGEERGDVLLAELRRRGAVGYAILLTGSAEPDLEPEGAPEAVLRKPFELEDLHRLLERLLAEELLEVEA